MNNITLNPTNVADENKNFSVTLNVDLKYVSQAINMANIFNEACIPQEGISFEKALSIAKSHDTLAVVGTHTVKGNSNLSQVWVAIDQLQNLIRMVQGAATENWMAFGIAAKAFIDLNAQKNGNYFTIFSEESNTLSYQYNMFDVTQNADTGSVIVGQLTSVDITITRASANVLALVAGSSITQKMNFKSMVIVEALKAE
ncbi:type-2Aa cytolytic delta-endotoxin [Dickeya chrysanthemi]|uniref:type-2Aa cytolytic delta-endotoxin n=1 Tax=Dickeya TaxID=204037 RepID=UPI0003A54901|nr:MULTISPECIES: type-2Aa cytolytic delta-endotoxin [Dickeya]TYL42963.1 type-2Aa cytolytic delta-endotoxin [Dickeya sp. ws52]WJM83617.1 type-2Aa cytolytic delta-endotoxin [Dickeya chrysanthemi]